MEAPRGNGRGRGGFGRGRGGGGAPQRVQQAAPLASQMRQVLRLEEPKEMATLRRFVDLGATRVQSTYGRTGLLEQQVHVPRDVAIAQGYEDVASSGGYITLLDAEDAMSGLQARRERERMLARREVRLPEARRGLSIGQLTEEERRILRLSQKEYNSFRVSRGTGNVGAPAGAPAPEGAQGAQPPPPAQVGGSSAQVEETAKAEAPAPPESSDSSGKGKAPARPHK